MIEHDLPLYAATPEPRHMESPAASGASASLVRMFGLDVRAAVLVTLVDLMVFGTDVFTAGAFIVMGIVIAAILGFIVYKIQRQWFGDEHESSLIKALIVGLLTAIPVPLTPLIAVPAGALGVFKLMQRKAA
ncbi:MAG TPA: hypothetical protein VG672_23610 [Bryobacteraceae bacterium]|nr:hypothetical protein [Bryobacteraceae bacterium]